VFAAGPCLIGQRPYPGLLSPQGRTGGRRIPLTGREIIRSLTPGVGRGLGLARMDTSGSAAPKVITHSCARQQRGDNKETWDCSACAHASHDTGLEELFVPDQYIARVLPAGAAGVDMFFFFFFFFFSSSRLLHLGA